MATPRRWSSLSTNQKLAVGALALGALALFARPNRGNVVTLDVKELATIIVTLTALPDSSLLANEKIVLYSEGGIHASQTWMLLRAKGFKSAYTLKGERAAAMAKFFGGSPQTGGARTAVAKMPEMPRVEAPAPAAGAGSVPPKKKKEGC